TALGDYLEAVCVGDLDQLGDELLRLERATITFLETGASGKSGGEGTLAARAQGPDAAMAMLARVQTCDSLPQALLKRRNLQRGESLVTPGGEWLGRDWLRLRRGGDPHAGVLERAQRLKQLNRESDAAAAALQAAEAALAGLRERSQLTERKRNDFQAQSQAAHREHGELRVQLGAMQARRDDAQLRRTRLEGDRGEVESELARARAGLAQAQSALDEALSELQRLDSQHPILTDEREQHRENTSGARSATQVAQLALREAMVRHESRRSTLESMQTTAARLLEQRSQLLQRHESLTAELADGDAPVQELRVRLQSALDRRVEVEADLANARQSQEDADLELRATEQRRFSAEQRVSAARVAMDAARMQAQESRVRRETLAEQFAETRFELSAITAGLAAEATVADWETRLEEVRADVEKLGPVNLAAIDELQQQSERKSYLDRQFADVSDALGTLEDAMKRMDKETRARFEDTFNRVNAGLKEKFPRLFGGGHAYLELVGDDPLAAGVAVMARPPGKRNSSISQLSGGEKALTAVALVFSIFDLNPAPFCLLDEVDAPLDEYNIGRFCDIVREMSARVQFLFITHN
ncbi:MAG: chromosome segregation protein SMC, partial [Steroidobacteraceae bacterium]